MTQSQKITLSQACGIPFNKLTLSQSNVRKIKAGISVEELAEDIARRGLLQSLHVRPELDDDGAETGLFEVPAGGRRYQALSLLVEQKRLNKTAPVPCIVRDPADGISAEDDSLAENTQRAPLHPLDQFRAFAALRDQGLDEAEIAAAFFATPQVVKQRLKLTTVAPSLLEAYAAEDMTLEQLMAFTVHPDPARQEEVWEAIKDSWNNNAHNIRRMLTETTVRAGDRRTIFVGEEAYEAAGGVILRDLFDSDGGGYFQDAALLDRLTMEKLKTCADEAAGEGWKWVAANTEYPYGHTRDYGRVQGTEEPLSDEGQARKEVLVAENEAIEAEYADTDEYPDEAYDRMEEIEEELQAFYNRPLTYGDEDKAQSGIFLSIDHDGTLKQERGWIRPEDMAGDAETPDTSVEGGATASVATVTIGDPEVEESETIKPLPDKLLVELTAYRTLALRNAMAGDPQVALTALLHKLVSDLFHRSYISGASVEASIRETHFPERGPDLDTSPAAQAIDQRHEDWKTAIPGEEADLWDWIVTLPQDQQLSLLAHCVSFGVNALHERPNAYGGAGVTPHGLERRMSEVDRLARATGLDLIGDGWTPTAENYLNRVSKARIIEAVTEGAGEQAAQLIDHLKKGDMANEAERLLADSGWLPEPLRLIDAPELEVEDVDLPDFLTADQDAEVPIAAE
ncbi:ParB/RepB/Spo0J family partition protein [Ruegeria sp. EL01]|uniref:ParB/RepB/Spo0J family partition protein n=1 Tax=Ruegeria sp. EL01 TaxID=2107578 RepID=UPI000EA831F6|nr:ParB/RepB/Spo0J family partition protein [Ruegeria sp. EL01]